MAWIESHQSLLRHPKLIMLSETLKVDRIKLIGHLHCLWWWALDFADVDGTLPAQITPKMLAEGAQFPSKRSADFVNALINCGGGKSGFVEVKNGHYVLHNWIDYAGKLILKRERDRDRKREERGGVSYRTSNGQSNGQAQGRPNDVAGTQPTVPTQPHTTVPNQPNSTTHPHTPSDEIVCVDNKKLIDWFESHSITNINYLLNNYSKERLEQAIEDYEDALSRQKSNQIINNPTGLFKSLLD